MSALLPEESLSAHQENNSNNHNFDYLSVSNLHQRDDSDSEDDTSNTETQEDEDNLTDIVVREAISALNQSPSFASPASIHDGINNGSGNSSNSNNNFGNKYSLGNYHTNNSSNSRSPKSDRHRNTSNADEDGRNECSHRKSSSGNKLSRSSETSGSRELFPDDGLDSTPMPELESYVSIDCNINNVSPDSGIQSVNGSPLHHVGSPAQHHSPYYASTSNNFHSASTTRPYSPSLCSQHSPPPPTLVPAVTPPHLSSSSPHYKYDESPNSPQMPLLKCQVDLPPWKPEGSAKQNILEEQGTFKVRGPGRPELKRSRGRPKGSKNKKSVINEGTNDNKSDLIDDDDDYYDDDDTNEKSRCNDENNDQTYQNNNDWKDNDTHSSVENLPPPPEPIPTMRRGPGRPKRSHKQHKHKDTSDIPSIVSDTQPIQVQNKVTDHYRHNESSIKNNQDLNKSANENISGDGSSPEKYKDERNHRSKKKHKKSHKTEKSLRRSRKHHRTSSIPMTAASKKCFSERIMHKIVNEKVKNSEKSDKLSVNGQDASHSEKDFLDQDPYSYEEQITSNLAQPYLWEKRKKNKGKGVRLSSDGIPLDERKRRRGRKMELPAIFRKVYGSPDKKNKIKNDFVKTSEEASNSSSSLIPSNNNINNTNTTIINSHKQTHKKKKKKVKQFKTKHKNIVDPVFLAELESLRALLEQCFIVKNTNTAQPKSGEALLPTIFRIRKISPISKKRRGSEKPKTSDRESGTEGESSKDRSAGKRKKKVPELPKQVSFLFKKFLY